MFDKFKYFIPAAIVFMFYLLMRVPRICSRCLWFCSDAIYVDIFFLLFVLPIVIGVYVIMWKGYRMQSDEEDMEYFRKTYMKNDSDKDA